jgi:hypothetical protein
LEDAVTGTIVGSYSASGYSGFGTQSITLNDGTLENVATMTYDVGAANTGTIDVPNSFIAVAAVATAPTIGHVFRVVLDTGNVGGCSTNTTSSIAAGPPTFILAGSSQTGTAPGSLPNAVQMTGSYTTFTPGTILSFGSCTGSFAPAYGGTLSTLDISQNPPADIGLKVWVAPHPGPLAQFNSTVNGDLPVMYARSYTMPTTGSPMPEPSYPCITGGINCVNSQVTLGWITDNHGGARYTAPVESETIGSQWTVTTWDHVNASQNPALVLASYAHTSGYGPYTNYVCTKDDSDAAVYINESAAGEDIVFKNVVFLNHGRAVFRGVGGGGYYSGYNNPPKFGDKELNPTSAYPNYNGGIGPSIGGTYYGFSNQGVQLLNYTIKGTNSTGCLQTPGGGVQIHGYNEQGPVWGNYINNYTALATGDDSLAIFNDIGGQTATFTVIGGALAGTYSASYPPSIINNVDVENSFVRSIGSYLTNFGSANNQTVPEMEANIKAALSGSSTVTLGSVTDSNQGASPSSTGSFGLPGALQTVGTSNPTFVPSVCDTYVISGCPILLTLDGNPLTPGPTNFPSTTGTIPGY